MAGHKSEPPEGGPGPIGHVEQGIPEPPIGHGEYGTPEPPHEQNVGPDPGSEYGTPLPQVKLPEPPPEPGPEPVFSPEDIGLPPIKPGDFPPEPPQQSDEIRPYPAPLPGPENEPAVDPQQEFGDELGRTSIEDVQGDSGAGAHMEVGDEPMLEY